MTALTACQLWLKGEMSIDQVMIETGHSSKFELIKEYVDMQDDYIASKEHVTSEQMEDEELEREAYERWNDLLHEEPTWLPQIKEVIKRQRQQELLAFAAAFNSTRRSKNVLQFTRH